MVLYYGMATHAMPGVTNGCGPLLDRRSSIKVWLIKRSRDPSKQDQAIKSKFWQSKILIAVADGSTGYIAVTTPCSFFLISRANSRLSGLLTLVLILL